MLKKVEALANVAVIITSVVLCSLLAKNYLFSPSKQSATAETIAPKSASPSGQQRHPIQPGTKVSLPGINWNTSNRTLILAISSTCHFCSESAPFYQELERQRTNGVRLVAVLPQPVNEGKNYLVVPDQVKS